MKPLALSGRAVALNMPADGPERVVLRLRLLGSPAAPGPRDAALVRTVTDHEEARAAGFGTIVSINPSWPGEAGAPASISLGNEFAYLADGDIIAVHSHNQRVRTLFRHSSRHNAFLVTERCNHYCLMCSQPPKDVDDSWILDEIETAIPLVDPSTRSIGFTGGEPLLEWRRFIQLLGQSRDVLPDTSVHVLTNGRGFADPEITKAWARVRHPSLCAGIPIYSAVDHIHDYVVQARGAFDETVLGVLRMKDQGQRVEIRVVLHSVTAPRLVETCTWLARNLPFVDHVALMGLENTGFAIANHDLLWIDPVDYRDNLAAAVDVLSAARVHVSVYNLPFCVLDPKVWPFAQQSISDWKNAYLPECDGCSMKNSCAGFFSTGRPQISRGIRPLEAV